MTHAEVIESTNNRRSRIAALEADVSSIERQIWDNTQYRAHSNTGFLIVMAETQLALARGWLGKTLQSIGVAYPYPNGNDATTDKIDAPAYSVGEGIDFTGNIVRNVKLVRTEIQLLADELLADELMADDTIGPMGTVTNSWAFVCMRNALTKLVEARLLLGEVLGALAPTVAQGVRGVPSAGASGGALPVL